jgi:hypothetical protein
MQARYALLGCTIETISSRVSPFVPHSRVAQRVVHGSLALYLAHDHGRQLRQQRAAVSAEVAGLHIKDAPARFNESKQMYE